jgi:hypothetical protein
MLGARYRDDAYNIHFYVRCANVGHATCGSETSVPCRGVM